MNTLKPISYYRVSDCHEVVPLLDELIDYFKADMNPLGYFAALYRLTTVRIVQGIEAGEFEDNARMARMDASFANRYFEAMARILHGEPTTGPWQVAAEASRDLEVSVFQHLFLGMNAHINLDLSLAAAHTCPGDAIDDFEDDFNKINHVLGSLVNTVQEDLCDLWHPFKVFLEISGPISDWITDIGLHIERHIAWDQAIKVAKESPENYEQVFSEMESDAADLARKIYRPARIFRPLVHRILKGEKGNVAYRIEEFVESSRNLQLT